MPSNESRQDVTFDSNGLNCAAWYYPSKAGSSSRPGPAVVLAHGLGGIKEMGLDRYSDLFHRAGYAVLTFDYRHFGESQGSPRQLLDINKQLADWKAAIEFVRAKPEIDAEQIGLFGTSFSGGHVLEIAKADPRIKAVVSQCPFTHGLASALKNGVWPVPKLAALAVKDILFGAADGSKDGRMTMVPLIGPPSSAACLNGHDAVSGYEALKPTDPSAQRFENGIGARFLPRIILYYPGAAARDVKAPIYFAVCGQDSCAPPGPTLKYAKQNKNPKTVVKLYESMGHFSIYVGKDFEIASVGYVNFLKENLPPLRPESHI